jgi:hypothetical protein
MTNVQDLDALRVATVQLSGCVAELAMITLEDRPVGSEVAAVDSFAEQVVELGSSVALAVREAAAIEASASVATLPAVDAALADASLRYWRDLSSYGPTSEMRKLASAGGREWRAWQRSVELALQRCEQPMVDALAAVRTVWADFAAQ